MHKLSSDFDEDEIKLINKLAGENYEILVQIKGECYILCDYGDYYYNNCFSHTDNEFFKKQKYEQTIPHRAIKFYNYYLIEVQDEKEIWYRSRKDENGNFELTCYSEGLEDAFDSL